MKYLAVLAGLAIGSCEVPVYGGDYGFRPELPPWDEAELVAKARRIISVACNSPASDAGILIGDYLMQVDEYPVANAIRPTYEKAIRVLQTARWPVTVRVCRGRCYPAVVTHTFVLQPRAVNWDACKPPSA